MKTRQGFTLIELLVVVLIIGILSSVALPQYTKAVEKARLSEALSNAKVLHDNANILLLENGGFPAQDVNLVSDGNINLSGGDITADGWYATKYFQYFSGCGSDGCEIQIDRLNTSGLGYSLQILKHASTSNNWKKYCYTQSTDLGKSICKSIENQDWEYQEGEL